MKKAFIVLIIGISLLACGLQTRKDNTSQLLDKTASIHSETSKAKSKDYTTLGFELMERETLLTSTMRHPKRISRNRGRIAWL